MREELRNLKLYSKVKAILKDKINSGIYSVTRKLPASQTLADEYNVSLTTIRRVLLELRNENLILLEQGKKPQLAVGVGRPSSAPLNILIAPVLKNRPITYEAGPWNYNIFSGMQSEFLTVGVATTLVPVESVDDIKTIVKNNSINYDGIIIFTTGLWRAVDKLISDISKPYCLISGQNEFNSVSPDYYNGSWTVADYFLEHSMNTFVFLKATGLSGVGAQKLRGFQESLLFRKIPSDRIHIITADDLSAENGRKAIADFLCSENIHTPFGIFTDGDYLASGAIQACQKKGMTLIHDYMIIGGTGLAESASFSPKLSVLEDPMFNTGQEASKMILKMIEDKSMNEHSLKLSMRLIHRETTLE